MHSVASRQLFSDGARSEPYRDQAAAREKRHARRRGVTGPAMGKRQDFADLNQGLGLERDYSNGTEALPPGQKSSSERGGTESESMELSAQSTGGGAVDSATISSMYSDLLPTSSRNRTGSGPPSSLTRSADPYDSRGLLAQRGPALTPSASGNGATSPQLPPHLDLDGSSETGSVSTYSTHQDEYLVGQGYQEGGHRVQTVSWQESGALPEIKETRALSPMPLIQQQQQQQPTPSCLHEVMHVLDTFCVPATGS